MEATNKICVPATGAALGPSLRSWRALHRVKQSHLGELIGVSQATVSRLESGAQAPSPREERRIRRLLGARLTSAADRELARFVRLSPNPVHLICDLSHRLLALSPRRERQLGVPCGELMGRSLWPFATEDLRRTEAGLAECGWFDEAPPAVEGVTAEGRSPVLHIPASRFRWVRFRLSDGSFVRLVETVR